MQPAVDACRQLCQDNERLANEFEDFVLPHETTLSYAYRRFDVTIPMPFYEFWSKETVQGNAEDFMNRSRSATKNSNITMALKVDNFPSAPEDLLALASLASLLRTLLTLGYSTESVILTDVISNYILYESTSGDDGAFRKIAIATEAEQTSSLMNCLDQKYETGMHNGFTGDPRSEGMVMNGIMAFGDFVQGGDRSPELLQTLSDYVAGAYYFLIALRRGDPSEMEQPRFRSLLRQLSSLIKMPPEVTQPFRQRLESILELATLAAICDAGTKQALRGFKGLLYHGPLIRRVHNVLLDTNLRGISQRILSPIVNMLAISIRQDNWSPYRDDIITQLLDTASGRIEDDWSLINFALERFIRLDTAKEPEIFSTCQNFLNNYSKAWPMHLHEMMVVCTQKGLFGLLWKSLIGESLTSTVQAAPPRQPLFDYQQQAFHEATHLGYPYVLKMIVEGLGMEFCKKMSNTSNGRGQTPLHLACRHRAPKEIFRLLRILGADVDKQDKQGFTPLHYCFPTQSALPSVYKVTKAMITEYKLPTVAPMDEPKAFGIYGRGKTIDSRVYDFRVIINQLLCRGADICIPSHTGQTPLHLAAQEGWGDNLDLFFLHDSADSERLQRASLRLRDDENMSVLDYARKIGFRGSLNGGEEIIEAEMRKRGMAIPLKQQSGLLTGQEPELLKMTIGKRSSPVSSPRTGPPLQPPFRKPIPESPNIPQAGPSKQQAPAKFPPAQVYRDPDVVVHEESATSSQNMEKGMERRPMAFPATQVYQDPDLESKKDEAEGSKRVEEKKYTPERSNMFSLSPPNKPAPPAYSQADPRQIARAGMATERKEDAERSRRKFFGKLKSKLSPE